MAQIGDLKRWFDARRAQILEDYFHFLRFPSISADPLYRTDCLHCAQWLTDYLRKGGLHSELVETPGLPLVYAEDLSAGSQARTVLIYGHYDVQPVDPVALWKSPPFEPTERDGSIFARGAVDDKGQIFYAILAVQCLKELGSRLPVNIKFCIEGEEESQSAGFSKALVDLQSKIKADDLLVVDFDQFDRNVPAVSLGARGIASIEITLTGSATDLHSGLYGGIAYNPNRALVELLAQLWDRDGRVQVPRFYDDVVELSGEEKNIYACRHEKNYYSKHFGIEAFGGEKGRSLHEASCLRPTLEINGIVGGYTGSGIKTVIPASAHAKITCRLVPNQDPDKICLCVAEFLKNRAVKGMNVEIVQHKGEPAFRGNPKSKLAQAIAAASTEVTGAKCRYVVSGGSIPIVPALMHASGAEAVGMGYGLIDDEIHAPNEHFDMHRFELGFLTIVRALSLL